MFLLYYTTLYYNILIVLTTLADMPHKKRTKEILSASRGNELFMYFDEYEYPKNNQSLRKLHKEMWEKYYTCLKRTFTQINSVKGMYSTALLALEGTSITLDCQLCISPDEMFRSNMIEWYYRSPNNNESNLLVEPSESTVISQKDWSLTFHTVKVGHCGEYSCRMGNMISGIYHLSVDIDTDSIRIVHTNSATNGPYETKEKKLLPYNLKMYTLWTEWTACSTCGIVGKRYRYGYCAIALLKNQENMFHSPKILTRGTKTTENYDDKNKDVGSLNQINNVILNTSDKEIKRDVMNHLKIILYIFNNRLPCKSELVPTEIKNISEIKNRPTEKMIGYCKEPCPRNSIFEVHDKRGNVLETANNSAGIYSIVQGIPPFATTTSRATVYQRRGNKFTLVCPSTVKKRLPLVWKKRNVILSVHNRKRIKLVAGEYLNFEKVEVNDSGIYSCWQNNENVGMIKLIVTDEMQLEMNQPITIVGSMLIVIVFLLIFSRTFSGKHKHAME